MLKSHMDAIEAALIATSQIPANSGHPLHKGTPRESFIRQFLQSHLPENVAIGTGEIIDANSHPGQARRQFDIVVYRKSYPKLDFGGGISAFLIEAVIATVEVKSVLTEAELETAITAARSAKSLARNVVIALQAGHVPPKVLNYVIAYDGPAHMQTVYNWIQHIHGNLGVVVPDLPAGDHRLQIASPTIDAVFVLHRGFIQFENAPVSFLSPAVRVANPATKWTFADMQDGNLLLLFLMLHSATANLEATFLDSVPYLTNVAAPLLRLAQ